MLFAILSALVGDVGQEPVPPVRYELVEYSFAIDPLREIGTRRTGVFCAPAGRYYWRDVKPDASETKETISHSLSAADPERYVSNDLLGGDPNDKPAYRVRAVVKSIDLSACSKKWGFGKFFRAHDLPFSGQTSVTVEWTTYDVASRKSTSQRSVTTAFSFQAAHDLAQDAVVPALVVNARVFASSPSDKAAGTR